MEDQPTQPSAPTPTSVAEIGSLARAVEAERAGRYVEAWTEALKAISLRPFHPEAYIQMASTAVAAGDPEAALRAAQRALALTPKWPTAQQVVTALERSLKARGKQRQKAHPIAWPELPDPNRKPRLSVCMIVKNEERFLGQCLASVKDIADELIVIDTGSTDRTVEIAREYGAQVGYFEWCNDFAAARNASIAPATGDWILFLDADEELSHKEKAELPHLLNQTEVSLYRLPLINVHQGELSKTFVPRLFINPPGLKFTGRIHEGVMTMLETITSPWQLEIGFGNLKILHHGYHPSVIIEKNKSERNCELLQKAIDENPDEFYFHMQMGGELWRMGNKNESIKEYELALSLAETIGFSKITPEVRETLLSQYSANLLTEKRYQDVVRVLRGKLASKSDLTTSQWMVLTRSLIHLRRPYEALETIDSAHRCREIPTLFPSAFSPEGSSLEELTGEVLFLNKKFKDAILFFESAFKKQEPELRAILAYAECLDANGEIGAALEFLSGQARKNQHAIQIMTHGHRLIAKYPALSQIAEEWKAEARLYCTN